MDPAYLFWGGVTIIVKVRLRRHFIDDRGSSPKKEGERLEIPLGFL
jgi:hypothetical protein